ncbi:hypothetical protein A0H81_11044 [Grifola frondosa]|uniref:Uncharacterized protein n=1 Tax=Grifola frondosa TaxID=5627 RepID=A0A1C7LWE3_GRIFR|nr:hypothetical protein A0H81_11044 [Grifola frondosa]
MGRSAKVHKRPQKKTSSTAASAPVARPAAKAPTAAPTPKEQKRHAGLKAKVAKHRKEGEGPVLGGADYMSNGGDGGHRVLMTSIGPALSLR